MRIVLPFGYDESYVYRLIGRYKRWITRRYTQPSETVEKARELELVNRPPDEFRKLVMKLAHEYAKELGVRINRIYVRGMARKWSSCSVRGNINISRLARFLPEDLVKYLVYHEVCHLIERNHGKRF